MKKKNFRPGTMGCHEALHMTSVLMDMIDIQLVQHPAIARKNKWCKMAIEASDKLFELYQDIGKKHQ